MVLALLGATGYAVARSKPLVRDTVGVTPVAWAGSPRVVHTAPHPIRQGEPFPQDKDGTVFFNRDRLRPAQKRGDSREHTAPARGRRHRGARHIGCGGGKPAVPNACDDTADHARALAASCREAADRIDSTDFT
ncbi:ribonuclease domain-containing protein [Tepidimonas sp.]|uniref:ribonuclease domain-containing protein n=1 Tax=Tepidimonas sp. TaxID=2002775 RepID=UPI004054B145